MQLVIDQGNSFSKIAIFKNKKLIQKEVVTSNLLLDCLRRVGRKDIQQLILSSVANVSTATMQYLTARYRVFSLDQNLRLPFTNRYRTPKTLGQDRIALIAAAVGQFPKQNCLVIDAGTCITYDLKTSEEIYLGGAISPGLDMRYRSLNQFTHRLPVLQPQFLTALIGDTTERSMHVGVCHGVVCEIEGVIQRYCNTYNELKVILTGGDAYFLSNRFKNKIFATSNFLLEGLNFILDYNTIE